MLYLIRRLGHDPTFETIKEAIFKKGPKQSCAQGLGTTSLPHFASRLSRPSRKRPPRTSSRRRHPHQDPGRHRKSPPRAQTRIEKVISIAVPPTGAPAPRRHKAARSAVVSVAVAFVFDLGLPCLYFPRADPHSEPHPLFLIYRPTVVKPIV